MIVDMNGPDIEAEDQMKVLSLETVNLWKNYKKRVPSRSSAGCRPKEQAGTELQVYCQLLWIWFSMIIKDD